MILPARLVRAGKGISMQNDSRSLAASLAKLWPNRLHESNWLKNLFCRVGMHCWTTLDLGELLQEKNVRFCRWCLEVKLDDKEIF
jgi:hypothetical protein